MHILIVEDEREIAEGIQTILEQAGYQTAVASSGSQGLEELESGIYDLALLDIMLPGTDGLTVLRTARSEGISLPVILLTARSQITDKIEGLDCGADDYLTKPFDAGELLARIRARLRHPEQTAVDTLSFADIRLEQATLRLCGPERSVKLARKEYLLLECLMRNRGMIMPRDTLITKIWGYDEETEYNQLDVYVSFVRKKLKFVSRSVKIVTTKGIGYSLEVQNDGT